MVDRDRYGGRRVEGRRPEEHGEAGLGWAEILLFNGLLSVGLEAFPLTQVSHRCH
jgi:hypothetical protein